MDAESLTFDYIAQAANNSLYDLSSQLRKVEKLVNRGNGASLASGVAQLGTQTANTTNLVHKAQEWNNGDLKPPQIKHKSELSNELDQLLRRVKNIQASVTHTLKLRQQHQEQKRQSGEILVPNEGTPLLNQSGSVQMQQQVLDQLNQSEVDLHTALIEERDSEISEIQRSTREINAIFQDLGILVNEQGQQLDTVEDNIANMARDTENASRQLVKAENYQRSKGKWTCIALSILLFLTIIIAITVIS